jgi:hypothetical protein
MFCVLTWLLYYIWIIILTVGILYRCGTLIVVVVVREIVSR